jgi:hypothetical protein
MRRSLRSTALSTPALFSTLVLLACNEETSPDTTPEPEPLPCGGATIAGASVSAGGRLVLPLDPALRDAIQEVSSSSEVEAWLEEDAIVVRAGYQAATATVTATCAEGTIEAEVEVGAFSMQPLTSWTDEPGAPLGREYFAWWMGEDRAIYLYGGFVYEPEQFTPSSQAYRFDLEGLAWTELETVGEPPPPGGRVAHADGQEVLYFGGTTLDDGGALSTPPTLVSAIPQADAVTFEPRDAAGAPGSYTGAFIRDVKRGRWLSVCGVDTEVLGLHCDVHAYEPEAGWSSLEVDGDAPDGRYGFHYAYDEPSDRIVVFAGQIGASNAAIGGDTWALELSPDGSETPRWVQLFEEVEGISKRRNGAYAHDPVGRRLFVWGGTPDGANSVPGLEVLSLDPGRERWTHIDLPATIPSRTSGGGVYDPVEERIYWGFGNDDAVYRDLYVLSLAAP